MFNADEFINDERFRPSAIDPRWNEYDETIRSEVAFYNQAMSKLYAGFVPLDWRWAKAMQWTEVLAGPDEKKGQWQQRPMRIGVTGDLGYKVISERIDNSDLVVPEELSNKIQNKSNMVGHLNVRAGIAYLFQRTLDGKGFVVWEDTPYDLNASLLSYTVTKEDNKGFSGIAEKIGTTTANLDKNN